MEKRFRSATPHTFQGICLLSHAQIKRAVPLPHSMTWFPMPLADSAYILLRNMIISGELAPDSAITENSIVERLAIGKTPVREAMRRLVLEGLLNVTPRLGYMVVGITREDIEEIFQLRMIAETAAGHLAMENLDDDALDRLLELSTIGYDPDDHESLLTYVGVNAEFHDIIAGASGNRRLADLVSRLMMESRRFIQVAVLSEEHGRQVSEQHLAIINALRERDADAVASTIRAHIEGGLNVTLESFMAGVTRSSSNGSH